MLKIFKTYLQYQIDGGRWERFGYSGWLCEEERNVELQKTIIENASFKQAFEHFENCPSHNVISCRTYIRHRPYICLIGAGFAEPTNLYQNNFTSLSIKKITEENKDVTLEWIIEHLSAEKTIQYLKERGLNICPIKQ